MWDEAEDLESSMWHHVLTSAFRTERGSGERGEREPNSKQYRLGSLGWGGFGNVGDRLKKQPNSRKGVSYRGP